MHNSSGQDLKIMNMSTMGDSLREEREKKNLTIDQAQKQTRINITILKALEEGRCDNILNPTYVKSFLKKYADFLGLDGARMTEEYRKIHPEEEPKVSTKLPGPEDSGRDISNIIIMAKVAAIGALIVAVLALAVVSIGSYIKRNKSAAPKPAAGVAEKKTVNAIRKTKPSAVSPQKAVKKDTAGSGDKAASIPKNVPLKLVLKVKQPVMVKVKTDGNLIFERVLSKGSVENFTANNAINIYVAKAEAIELVLNGKSLGSPGRGVMKNVEITRKGLKIE